LAGIWELEMSQSRPVELDGSDLKLDLLFCGLQFRWRVGRSKVINLKMFPVINENTQFLKSSFIKEDTPEKVYKFIHPLHNIN
jgi:hypothetical protein